MKKKYLINYLFLLPWFFFLIVFTVFPYLYGIFISFFEVDYRSQTFVGLLNFINVFKDPLVIQSLVTTLIMSLISIPLTIGVSLWVANELQNFNRKFQGIAKSIIFLPTIICQVALAITWKFMFNPSFGLTKEFAALFHTNPINWLGDASLAIPLIAVIVMTFNIAQPVIIFFAAINNISRSVKEAALLDGVSRFGMFRYITLPLLKPNVVFVTITTTIASLQIFMVPFLLTNGGPNNKTVTVLYLLYKNAFEYGQYGFASAIGTVLFFVIGIFVFIQYKLSRGGEVA